MTARVSMLLKSCASPDMLPFSLCNKKRLAIRHMNRPLFPTTLLIPSYDIGKYVGLRTYQHPFIYYKAFRPKYCFLGSMFFMKCDKLIQKTKDGLDSKVPFSLALGQRSFGNSLYCYSPRRKRLLNISSTLST